MRKIIETIQDYLYFLYLIFLSYIWKSKIKVYVCSGRPRKDPEPWAALWFHIQTQTPYQKRSDYTTKVVPREYFISNPIEVAKQEGLMLAKRAFAKEKLLRAIVFVYRATPDINDKLILVDKF
jgi:hypothetical protein